MTAHARTGSASGEPAESVSPENRHVKVRPGRLPVTEMLFDRPGAASPFGEDITFPLPADQIGYQLPDEGEEPENRAEETDRVEHS